MCKKKYCSILIKSDLGRACESNYFKMGILEVFCVSEFMGLVCLQVQTSEVLDYLRHESIFNNSILSRMVTVNLVDS